MKGARLSATAADVRTAAGGAESEDRSEAPESTASGLSCGLYLAGSPLFKSYAYHSSAPEREKDGGE